MSSPGKTTISGPSESLTNLLLSRLTHLSDDKLASLATHPDTPDLLRHRVRQEITRRTTTTTPAPPAIQLINALNRAKQDALARTETTDPSARAHWAAMAQAFRIARTLAEDLLTPAEQDR